MYRFGWGVVCLLLAAAPLATAQNRTFVSSTGVDTNPCTVALPCRTFAAALLVTPAKGEILALDTAGYGQVTITRSVTIDGNGTRSSISGASVVPVTINDPLGTAEVRIRNIAINGIGGGTDGIRFQAGLRLTLDDVSIAGFTGKGIHVSTNLGSFLTMKDVSVEDTGGIGIDISPGGGSTVVVHAKNLRVSDSTTTSAVYLNGNVKATIADSEFVNCANGAGITLAGNAQAALDHVIATNNKWGVYHYLGAPTTRLMHSMLIGNTLNGALSNGLGTITAYQSNIIENPSGVTSTPPL